MIHKRRHVCCVHLFMNEAHSQDFRRLTDLSHFADRRQKVASTASELQVGKQRISWRNEKESQPFNPCSFVPKKQLLPKKRCPRKQPKTQLFGRNKEAWLLLYLSDIIYITAAVLKANAAVDIEDTPDPRKILFVGLWFSVGFAIADIGYVQTFQPNSPENQNIFTKVFTQ